MEVRWYTGLNNFKKHTLKNGVFSTELREFPVTPQRKIDDILYDNLFDYPGGPIEMLFSGGLDSEFVLRSLIKHNLKINAITLVIKIKGAVVNVVDLYYSEKFCRENNVPQYFFELDAEEFYGGGEHINYLLDYSITEPHVASHFWLIEKCHNFPIIGGDWPWVQVRQTKNILSPFKLDYSSYEKFMNDRGINGIGNMISHSYESSLYFIRKQIEHHSNDFKNFHTVPFLKYKMYGLKEPRIKSYGWEQCPINLFNIMIYKLQLINKIGKINHKIIWGEGIANTINGEPGENDKFF